MPRQAKPPFELTIEEYRFLRSLDRPWKIQQWLNAIPRNFEPEGDTCLSPRRVMRERRAHCIEGALLAALALRLRGARPLIVDLVAAPEDDDHVIAVFQQRGHWGAISKSNHAVLRYREPIYRTIRELALSYFHEYLLQSNGKKTLRGFSRPVDLSRFDADGWITSEKDVWMIPNYLCDLAHTPILSRSQIQGLRRADNIELEAGALLEWQPGIKPKA